MLNETVNDAAEAAKDSRVIEFTLRSINTGAYTDVRLYPSNTLGDIIDGTEEGTGKKAGYFEDIGFGDDFRRGMGVGGNVGFVFENRRTMMVTDDLKITAEKFDIRNGDVILVSDSASSTA